ncbi:MAG: cupin domain-containing protein [Actinomycetota bacterium]
MEPRISRTDPTAEFATEERCHILEWWNDSTDDDVSIARARVAPGVTTALHRVAVHERYLILEGRGLARVGGIEPAEVGPGDVVVVPAGVAQQIINIGEEDLVFACVCTPRFRPECYEDLEARTP